MTYTQQPNKTFLLAGSTEVNRLGYGSMQLTGPGVWGDAPQRESAMEILKEALQQGVNFIDTADSYGPHTNETLIQDALGDAIRTVIIATKGGFERPGPNRWVPNGRPEYIEKAIEGSLQRLKTKTIDLWQLHRVDPKVPVEETLLPVAEAVKAGKIKWVGLSEVDIDAIERAQTVLPIVSVQNLYNLGNRQWENVLQYTTKNNMAFIPWFPLASGPGKLADKTGRIAASHQATVAQVALAWLLQRAPNILLIPGTRSSEHLRENLSSSNVILTQEEFDVLAN